MKSVPIHEISSEENAKRYYEAFTNQSSILKLYRAKAEETIKSLGNPDFEIYQPYIIDAYFPYSSLAVEYRSHSQIALFALAQNADNMRYVPIELKIKSFLGMAFKLNPVVVKHFTDSQKAESEIMESICKHRPDLFKHFSNAQKEDAIFCSLAVKINPSIYHQLSEEMRSTKIVVDAATKKLVNGNPFIADSFFESNKVHIGKDYKEQKHHAEHQELSFNFNDK